MSSIAVPAAPEARLPQSRCTLQSVFRARLLGSMAPAADESRPQPRLLKLSYPPPLLSIQSEKMRAGSIPRLGGNWTGFKGLLRPGEAAFLKSFVRCLQRHLHLFALEEKAPKAPERESPRIVLCRPPPPRLAPRWPVWCAEQRHAKPARFKDWAPSLSAHF